PRMDSSSRFTNYHLKHALISGLSRCLEIESHSHTLRHHLANVRRDFHRTGGGSPTSLMRQDHARSTFRAFRLDEVSGRFLGQEVVHPNGARTARRSSLSAEIN